MPVQRYIGDNFDPAAIHDYDAPLLEIVKKTFDDDQMSITSLC